VTRRSGPRAASTRSVPRGSAPKGSARREHAPSVARTKPPRPDGVAGAVDITLGGAPARPATRPEATGRLGRLYDRILEALARVEAGEAADRALEQVFRAARDLGPRERAEVTERVYEVLRLRRAADDVLDRAARVVKRRLDVVDAPVRMRLRVLAARLLAGGTLDDALALDAYAARRIPGLLDAILGGKLPPVARRTAVEQLAIDTSLPTWLVERLVSGLGEARGERIARGLLGRAPLTIRPNTLRIDRDALAARLLADEGVASKPTLLAQHGLVLGRRLSLEASRAFQEGLFEVQDEGSQLIGEVLGARAGEVVADACAGAGGKTLALAAAMDGHGRLLCFDVEADKLDELQTRARRAGLTNHEVHARDFVLTPPELVGRIDRVLVDAPCTGTGTLRRQVERRLSLDPIELERMVPRQRALLTRAIDVVKPGGIVAYATCSVLREENEDIVASVLADEPRAEPLAIAAVVGAARAEALGASGHELRVGPGPSDADPDGFYVALLRRRAS
jgi:16S rRNA (cytosine967-C5)-methyltransferase